MLPVPIPVPGLAAGGLCAQIGRARAGTEKGAGWGEGETCSRPAETANRPGVSPLPSCPLGGLQGVGKAGETPPCFSVACALWNPGVSPRVHPCWEPSAEQGPAARGGEGTERAQRGDPRLHRGQAECGDLTGKGSGLGALAGEWAVGFRGSQQKEGPKRPRAGSTLGAWQAWAAPRSGDTSSAEPTVNGRTPHAPRSAGWVAGGHLSTEAAKGPQSRLHPVEQDPEPTRHAIRPRDHSARPAPVCRAE